MKLLLVFLFHQLIAASICKESVPLELFNDDTRYSFIQKPTEQQLSMSFPGCGDDENRVVTWYRVHNHMDHPINVVVTATSNTIKSKQQMLHSIHRTFLRVSDTCPFSKNSAICIANNDTTARSLTLNFVVPPKTDRFLATYEFLNSVNIQSHLFIQLKVVSNDPSQCKNADEVIFPLSQLVVSKSSDTINGELKMGKWHRISSLMKGQRYIIDTCSAHASKGKKSKMTLYTDCKGTELKEGIKRTCKDGLGSIIIITPSQSYAPIYLFVETEAPQYAIHFQTTTSKTSHQACAEAMFIPYIPYIIHSIPFAQYPLTQDVCTHKGILKSTAFFGVNVHPNHEIQILTCNSPTMTEVSVLDECNGKCLTLKKKECNNGGIYTYTPTNQEGHSIIVAVSETKMETFGHARVMFREHEIGNKHDRELHIGVGIDRKALRKIAEPLTIPSNQHQALISDANQSNSANFVSIVFLVTIAAVFLLGAAFILIKKTPNQPQYIPL